MSRCDVWISDINREHARPLVESMNTPDAAAARLPVQSWPARLNWNGPGPTFSMEEGSGRSLIGLSTKYDVFGRNGWTPKKFAQFIASREELHVPRDKAICPTLAVLSGYLRSPIFVFEHSTGASHLSFITVDGNVARAQFDGGEEELDRIRRTFFTEGLEAALALPGLDHVQRPGAPGREPRMVQRMLKMVPRLQEWWGSYERGERVRPAGAELSSLDLLHWREEDMDVRTGNIAFARTSKHLYELFLPTDDQEHRPLDLFCSIDGVLQPWTDPATGEEQGFGAYPADWAEWIIQHSVPDGQASPEQPEAGRPWEGEGMEALLHRAANNIVAYDEYETVLMSFLRAPEVERWLQRSLGGHNALISVHLLDDISFSLASENMPFYEHHAWDKSEGPDTKIGYYPRKFRPWSGTETWRHPETRRHSWGPSMTTETDGQTLQSFAAVNCLKFSAVKDHLHPANEWADRYSWFVFHLEGSDTCILMPYWRCDLTVSTDNDGASASISGHEFFDNVDAHARKTNFEDQWSNWLNGNPLTQQAISEGLAAVETLIERSGDEPDDEDW